METQDHILVVDDDADIRGLLGLCLKKNGYKASVAAEGKAMWTALSRGKVDLIVLDPTQPGDDGLSPCRKLRVKIDRTNRKAGACRPSCW
ncbi:MAG: response regulator [Betaproteobacteria bacterium]|nr:MAG: response regulator [Betaproteobacteria bacterium]